MELTVPHPNFSRIGVSKPPIPPLPPAAIQPAGSGGEYATYCCCTAHPIISLQLPNRCVLGQLSAKFKNDRRYSCNTIARMMSRRFTIWRGFWDFRPREAHRVKNVGHYTQSFSWRLGDANLEPGGPWQPVPRRRPRSCHGCAERLNASGGSK